MALTKVYSIPGCLETSWSGEAKAIIDSWSNYNISLENFKDAVLVRGLDYAKKNKGVAWIVDSSNAKGVFTQECQNLISSDIFPAFHRNGIKYFITITSQSSLTRMSIKSYQAKTGPHGLQLVEVASLSDAIEWLKQNNK